jgi:hypothetical protein
MLPPLRTPTKRPRDRLVVPLVALPVKAHARHHANASVGVMGEPANGVQPPSQGHNTARQITSTSRAAEKERPVRRPAADDGPRVREPLASPSTVSDPDRMATDADSQRSSDSPDRLRPSRQEPAMPFGCDEHLRHGVCPRNCVGMNERTVHAFNQRKKRSIGRAVS